MNPIYDLNHQSEEWRFRTDEKNRVLNKKKV